MGKDLMIPVTLKEMQPVLEHWAMAAKYSREAWLHVEATLPLVREVCPEYYEEVAARIIAAFQEAQAIEGFGDAMVEDLKLGPQLQGQAKRQLSPAALDTRPLA